MHFGAGGEFYIHNDCDKNNSSTSNIGYTYKAPEGITYNTEKSKNYLAGSYNFKVREVEAFRVIFIE